MIRQPLDTVKLIESFYGDKTAERSKVRLINHIHEGIKILEYIGATTNAIEAFALHPMFQEDEQLQKHWHMISNINPNVVCLLMEYRATANWCLSDQVFREEPKQGHWQLNWHRKPKLSPLPQVNNMLIADKVQNYKDFIRHHLDRHERSKELEAYFKEWLKVLGLTEDDIEDLTDLIQ